MSIREFLDALRSTQGQHTLASVLEGPESGARLLLCEGVPVWPARPEGLLARNLPALAGCGASGILTLENKRIFVEKFGGAPRLVICGGGHVAESVVRLAVMLGLPVTGLEERPEYADALRRAGQKRSSAALCRKSHAGGGQCGDLLCCRHPRPLLRRGMPYRNIQETICLRWYAGQPKPVGPCPPPAHRGRNCSGKDRRTPRSHWSRHQGADSAGNRTIHPRGDR